MVRKQRSNSCRVTKQKQNNCKLPNQDTLTQHSLQINHFIDCFRTFYVHSIRIPQKVCTLLEYYNNITKRIIPNVTSVFNIIIVSIDKNSVGVTRYLCNVLHNNYYFCGNKVI